MSIVLTQGTVEYLIFDWVDSNAAGPLTTLVGAGAQYDVKDTTTPVHSYYTAQTGTVNSPTPMRLYCLIDTTTSPVGTPGGGGVWPPGDYKIWVKLTSPPGAERPRLGPFTFTVQL